MATRFFSYLLVFLLAQTVHGQENGRLAAQKSRGIELIEKGRFQEAAGILEGVWEQNQTDPKMAEFLAIAYMDGDHDLAKAEPLLEKAIAMGGQATFLVQHSHEKFPTLLSGGTITDFCSGRLSFQDGKLSYTADNPEHSFQITPHEFKEMKRNESNPQGLFSISLTSKKNYVFRPRDWTPKETQLIHSFVKKYVTHSE